MSTQTKKSTIAEEGISTEAISHYLQTHPEFFQHNAQLLTYLQIPHLTGGSAVSLVERQIEILRQKNRKLERKLHELIDVARSNDSLAQKIHRLAQQLIKTGGSGTVCKLLEAALREDFGANQSVMVLFADKLDDTDSISKQRFVHLINRGDDITKSFKTFFESARPRCGQIRDVQRDFLFGKNTDEVGSVALVPLGPKSTYGLLAIGSADSDRFHPAMRTDFLARIGDLVSAALAR